MIIVEGPDGAGKSTLVKQICSTYGLDEAISHVDRDRMNEVTKERAYGALAEAVKGSGLPRVYDRVYFSELVYGPVWRGEIAFNAHEQNHINEVLRVLDCPIIFCLPSYTAVEENVLRTTQMNEVAPNINEIYGRYERLSRAPSGNTYRYDYENTDLRYFLEMAIEPYLTKRKERTWR